MIVKTTTNLKEIESVLLDSEIQSRVSCDGMDSTEIPDKDVIYIGGYVKGKIIAVN